MGIARPWLRAWRTRVALVWIVGVSVATVVVNARYARPDFEATAAHQRAIALDVDSSSRSIGVSSTGDALSDSAIGPNTQYLFDRAAERQRYATDHPLYAWRWNAVLTLFTMAALPFIFAMGWLGRRVAG